MLVLWLPRVGPRRSMAIRPLLPRPERHVLATRLKRRCQGAVWRRETSGYRAGFLGCRGSQNSRWGQKGGEGVAKGMTNMAAIRDVCVFPRPHQKPVLKRWSLTNVDQHSSRLQIARREVYRKTSRSDPLPRMQHTHTHTWRPARAASSAWRPTRPAVCTPVGIPRTWYPRMVTLLTRLPIRSLPRAYRQCSLLRPLRA